MEVFILEQKDVQNDVNSDANTKQDEQLNVSNAPKEQDITAKVKPFLRYGLPIIILVVIALVFGIFKWQQSRGTLEVSNAKVASSVVHVSAQSDGNLTQLLVNDGDKVEAGQVIAKMKVVATPEQIQDLQKAYDEAKTNFDNLQNQVKATTTTTRTVTVPSASTASGPSGDVAGAQARLEAAAANKEKMEKLYSIGAVSATEYAEAESAYTSAQAALRSASVPASSAPSTTTRQVQETVPAAPSREVAEALANAQVQLEQAQAALEQAQSDDNYADITAPVSGIISLTDFKEGDNLKQGDVIINIGNTQELWVEAPLTDAQYSQVRPGQFVQYTIDNTQLTGTVLEVTHAGDDSNEDSNTPTAAKISLPDEMLDQVLPGTDVKVKISLDK